MKLKKLLALLLVMGMVVSITPMGTLAEGMLSEEPGASNPLSPEGSETPDEGDGTNPAAPGEGDGTNPAAPGEGDGTNPAAPGEGDGTDPAAPGEGDGTDPAAPGEGDGTDPAAPGEGDGTNPAAPGEDDTNPAAPGEGDGTNPATPGEGEEIVLPEDELPMEALPNPDAVYDGMTLEELFAHMNALLAEDEEAALAYVEQMQAEAPEVFEQLLAYAMSTMEEEETPETEEFTDAGAFLDPVDLSVATVPMSRMARVMAFSPQNFSLQTTTPSNPNGLELIKTATSNGNGYQINLEAWVTGEVVTTQVPKPVDIILVLDQSGSMANKFNGEETSNYNISRQKAMKDTVSNFIDTVDSKAAGMPDASKHRIALVTFANSAETLSEFQSDYTALQSLVNGLPNTPNGSTNTGAGMQNAYSILNGDSPPAGARHKVVILFTDGVPTTSSIFNPGVADTAVLAAKSIKDNGAVVYTVGIFNGANADQTEPTGGGGFSETAAANRFMNYTSSNFRYATNTGLERNWFLILTWLEEKSGFSRPTRTASNYYLTAASSDTLDGIFQNIAQNIDVPGITLGPDTLVKDFMSEYFDADTASVQVSTRDYLGNGNWATATTISPTVIKDSTSVSVTGFDFSHNFVSETVKTDGSRGKKLIITLNVTPKPGFFGGNEVPTNQNSSGIYSPNDEAPVGVFQEPTVHVPIRYQIASRNQAIYLGNPADLNQLLQYQSGYTPDGWNNAYVNIDYQLRQGSTTIGSYTIGAGSDSGSWTWENGQTGAPVLGQDTTYTLSCSVTPNYSGTQTGPSISAQNPTVYVYKPQLTLGVSDLWADYQKQVNLGEWALSGWATKAVDYKPDLNATWVISTAGQGAQILGVKPTIADFSGFSYAFATKAGTTGDATLSDSTATTGKKDTNFTAALTGFQINGNSFGTNQASVATQYPNNQDHFTLHTNRFNLTVTKTDYAPLAYGPQSFLFDLSGEGNALSLSFSLARGMDSKLSMSKTIAGLLCGQSYSVSERGDWSWRYNSKRTVEKTLASSATSHEEPSKSDPHGGSHHSQSLEFVNTFTNHKWLTGSCGKANTFS